MLSSVSLSSPAAASILQKIANPYYMRTLLQILMLVSDNNKFIVLSIIEDLVKLNLPLDVDEGTEPLLQINHQLGSYLSDFIFAYARINADLGNFDIVKILIKFLLKLGYWFTS